MCPCYGSFCVRVEGVTYERVHTDIGLYMCVHIIQRHDDVMKEKGGEGRERKERDIYIYKIYRVAPLLSAGVVPMRQHAPLLYARVYYTCTYSCTRTYIYKCIPSSGHIRIRVRASARECACTCT